MDESGHSTDRSTPYDATLAPASATITVAAENTSTVSDAIVSQNSSKTSANADNPPLPEITTAPSTSQAVNRRPRPIDPPLVVLSSDSEPEDNAKLKSRDISPEVLYCGPGKAGAIKRVLRSASTNNERSNPKKGSLSDKSAKGATSNPYKHVPITISKLRQQASKGSEDGELSGASTSVNFDTLRAPSAVAPCPAQHPQQGGKKLTRNNKLPTVKKIVIPTAGPSTSRGSPEPALSKKQRKKERKRLRLEGASTASESSEPPSSAVQAPPPRHDVVRRDNTEFSVPPPQTIPDVVPPPPTPAVLSFLDLIIPITSSACWLLLTEESVAILGIIRATCYAGSAEICGYLLTPTSDPLVIPSFHNENWLSVCSHGEPVSIAEFEHRAMSSFDREYVIPCCELMDRFPGRVRAVLFLSNTNELTDPLLWHCVKLYPNLLPTIVDSVTDNTPLKNYVVVRQGEGYWKEVFHRCYLISIRALVAVPRHVEFKNDFWRRISQELLEIESFNIHNPVILLCGSKNVGKSTTVRYIINHLLRKYPVVQCLDCDIGQSECNPPGCLAVHSLDKPLLGPPFCRPHEPDQCVYLGEVTPSDISQQYTDALAYIVETGRNPYLPLIINTMGWVERLGLELLEQTSKLIQPILVIELIKPMENCVSRSLARAPSSKVLLLATAITDLHPKSNFSPAFRRKVSVMAYLSRISPTFGPVNNVVPYRVRFSDISIYFTDSMIPVSHYFTVMLGSYVGLVVWNALNRQPNASSSAEQNHDVAGVNILKHFPIGRCVGFGIVRAIDVEKKLLFILTPIHEEGLKLVNVLVHGTIAPPEELYLRQDIEKYEGIVPRLQYLYAFEE